MRFAARILRMKLSRRTPLLVRGRWTKMVALLATSSRIRISGNSQSSLDARLWIWSSRRLAFERRNSRTSPRWRVSGAWRLPLKYMLKSLLRFVMVYLIVSAFASIALLADTWPYHPTSLPAWSFLFVVAIPVTVVGEWLAEGVLNNPVSASVERRTRQTAFSWTRVAYYLAVYVLLGICAVTLYYWVTGSI